MKNLPDFDLKDTIFNAYMSALSVGLSVVGLIEDNGKQVSKASLEMLVDSVNTIRHTSLALISLYADSYNA